VTPASAFVLRVWLPDRPGVLGLVASRIGAVGGDLAGIEIVDRGAGRAVDELLLELPDPGLVDMLIREVSEVDGVDVEDVRPAPRHRFDGRLGVLDAATDMVAAETLDLLVARLAGYVHRALGADWTTVVDIAANEQVLRIGEAPAVDWLLAFARGASASETSSGLGPADESGSIGAHGPESMGPRRPTSESPDVAWAVITPRSLVVLLGRDDIEIRPTERAELEGFAALAGQCLERVQEG
jgi:hypothetical protein